MNPMLGMLAGPLVLVLVLVLCHVSDRRDERKRAIETAERQVAINAAWASYHDPLLQEAQREVDAMFPGTPLVGDGLPPGMTAEQRAISTRFQAAMLAKGVNRTLLLDSLIPPDAKAAGVRPAPPPLPPPRYQLFETILKD